MFNTVFLILLFMHILGNFYFQGDKPARQKTISAVGMIKHYVIYVILCLSVIAPVYNKAILICGVSLAVGHGIAELIKFFCIKRRVVYIIDQVLHLIFIAVIAFVFAANNQVITVLPVIKSIFEIIGLSAQKTFMWLLVFLLIWKPANTTIKELLSLHKPYEDNSGENIIKPGGFIGLLERLIILALLSINQYSAIGLVLTAKSIARYDKISKDQVFAEYYLLGTLLSTLIVIIVYFIVIRKLYI